MDLKKRIEISKEKACNFLLSMQVEEAIFDTSISNKRNVEGMTLPATYNAISALGLMNSLHLINKEKAKQFLLEHKKNNGIYRMKGMKKKELTHPTFEYVDFHITNYTISALEYIGYKFSYKDFSFLKKYYGDKKMLKWLGKRDMAAPWLEGNYVVNLASFIIKGREIGINGSGKYIEQMIQWHYDNQDEHGYYHDEEINDLTNAFAGATHNYHIFYYYNLPIARYKQVIDYILTRPTTVESACLDVDEVDVLANFIKYGYRCDDIKQWMEKKLISLLDFQNSDGGFSDETCGNRLFDGWKKYSEMQGTSNCFATWFRMIAIGMISYTLFADESFSFRDSIGIGYFNKNYLSNGFDQSAIEEQEKKIMERMEERKIASQKKQTLILNNDKVEDLIEMFKTNFEKVDEQKLNFEATFSVNIINEGSFNIDIKGKTIKIEKGANENANLQVTLKRQTLMKIISGKLDARLAYGLGKLKCKGNISYAIKLSVLM